MGVFAQRNAFNFARMLSDDKKANCIVMDYLYKNKMGDFTDPRMLSDNTKINNVTWA